jgi:demethylmenaquinone methyltransferase/2-methoxy-6-polyprenyl-1,4-benzoquinol methylase
MFNSIAPDYDRFNSWASFGLHQRWRRELIRHIPQGARVLDLATGTGDVAFLAAESGHSVVGLDFSEEMLARARSKDRENKIRWVQASAHRLPFSDRSFGCITSAFALRNIRGTLDAVFQETFRVLQLGGKALHLDFGRPSAPLARWGHRLHLQVGVPLIGQWICRERWPKGYLTDTIEGFFGPQEVAARLQKAGFKQVRHIDLLWGAVRVYEGVKLT